MATKAEILKHYQETLRREWELESRFASIRRDLAILAERKKMLEASLLSDAESTSEQRPALSLGELLKMQGREMIRNAATLPESGTPSASAPPRNSGLDMPSGATPSSPNPGVAEGSTSPLPGLLRRRRMGIESLPARILAWMENYPADQVHKAETICEAFPGEEKALMLDALRRLHDRRQIVRPARGLYRIANHQGLETEEVPM